MKTIISRIVFSESEQVVFEKVGMDLSLEPDMVLFRTQWSLISPGTELAIYTNRRDIGGKLKKPYPAYPGYAAVGVIEDVGSNIEKFAPRDRVFAISPHASLTKFDPSKTFCMHLPDDIKGDQATFIRMALVTLATLCKADIRAGEWLGVVGLGLVGNLGAQLGQCAGFNLIGVGRSHLRSDVATKCGIHNILIGNTDEIFEDVQTITEGSGCQLVLDTSGTTGGLQKAISLSGDGGTISLIGTPWISDPTVSATTLTQPIFSRYLTLEGGWEWSLPLYEKDPGKPRPMLQNRHSVEANARHALNLIKLGKVQIKPLITHRLPPSIIHKAYQGLLHNRNEYLGVLIDWRDEN